MTLEELKQVLTEQSSPGQKLAALELYNSANERKFDSIDEALSA